MPRERRPWGDKTFTARAAWQVTRRRREQGPIGRPELRPRHLAAQNLELVPQHQQLDVRSTVVVELDALGGGLDLRLNAEVCLLQESPRPLLSAPGICPKS